MLKHYVLGIDPAPTHYAFSLVSDTKSGGVIDTASFSFSPWEEEEKGTEMSQYALQLGQNLHEFLVTNEVIQGEEDSFFQPMRVAIEFPAGGHSVQGVIKVACACQAALSASLDYSHGLPRQVYPYEWKKTAGLKGSCSKNDVFDYCIDSFSSHPLFRDDISACSGLSSAKRTGLQDRFDATLIARHVAGKK